MKKMYAAAVCAAAMAASAAQAANVEGKDSWAAERFQIRGRVIEVAPQENSWASVGGDVKAGNALMPEVDLSYYFTNYISAELIAATTQHSLRSTVAGDLGRTWILPPTLTLQYHFMPSAAFQPYVGAGINYSLFYGEDSAKGNGITDLKVNGGWGYALQAGADYWINDHWGVNADVKKLFLNVDAKVNGGSVRADVDLDPWIVGAGVSYRF